MSQKAMTSIAHERYEQFDAVRRQNEALDADLADLKELEQLEQLEQLERQLGSRSKPAR